MQRFYLTTNACGRTFTTVAQRIYTYLHANGLAPTEDLREADLIVLDTCAYCQATEESSMSSVRYAMQHRAGATPVVVVGCLPAINPKRLSAVDGVRFLNPGELQRLDALTGATVPFETVEADDRIMLRTRPAEIRPEVQRAFHITVGTGCVNSCTFCAVKRVWGQLKSKPIAAVVRELRAGVKMGHEVFYLAGQDLGAYGMDIGSNVVELLSALYEVEGDYRLILHDFNPQWLIKHLGGLGPLLERERDRVAYLDVPLQAGSDRILKRMKRPYSADAVWAAMVGLREAAPELLVELDIMVGFPGETDEDFARSQRFLAQALELGGVAVWLAGYSERPDIPAAALDARVDGATIMARFNALKAQVAAASGCRLGTGLSFFPQYRM